jgi:hypothetical protein
MTTDDAFRKLRVGNRPFEQRIEQMYQIEGGRTPIFAIWIVGHLDDFVEDYPNQMKRLYNSFLIENLDTDPIEYQTMLRYIRLLAVERDDILVESDPSDHTVQSQTEGTRFPKNYYRVKDSFRTDWVDREPEGVELIGELREPIPDLLLEPWESKS